MKITKINFKFVFLPVNINRSMKHSSQAKTKVLCLGQPDPPSETPRVFRVFLKKNNFKMEHILGPKWRKQYICGPILASKKM